jgi:hypothetical protein
VLGNVLLWDGGSSFSPCGRRWREAPDEGGATGTVVFRKHHHQGKPRRARIVTSIISGFVRISLFQNRRTVKPVGDEERVTLFATRAFRRLRAVGFNDEAILETDEVRDVRWDWRLLAELDR